MSRLIATSRPTPEVRGAKVVIVHLRKMLGDDDEEGA